MSKRIFISKPIEEVPELVDFCQQNDCELVAESFLTFQAVPFSISNSFDVIFFGSKRAIEFYLKQEKIEPSTLIACVGEGTAKYLTKCGYKASFIGDKSGDINTVAHNFKNWLGNKKVLFAQAKDSNRSISSVLQHNQFKEVSVYQTDITGKKIKDCSIYIFTSPSNAKGFLMENELQNNNTLISWGTTTQQFLNNQELNHSIALETSTIEELINLLKTI